MFRSDGLQSRHANLRKLLSAMVFITVALAANGFAETGKMGTEQESERGKKLYVIYCQSCHGQNGIGQAPIPWSIRNSEYFVPPALDDSQHAWHHSDEDLIKMILEGSPRTKQMPSWKKLLSKQDAADLVAYMKSLWGPRALECQGPKHMSCLRE